MYIFSAILYPLSLSLLLMTLGAVAMAAEPEALHERLQALAPDQAPDLVIETPVPGLWEVIFDSDVFYFSADGRFLIRGQIIDLENRVNLTEQSLGKIRQALIEQVTPQDMISFGPDDAKYHIMVFTDVDCTYCRRLHQQIDGYLAEGIQVSYLLWPRGSEQSPTYAKSVNIYCADDQQAALTAAKQGKTVPEQDCDHPLAKLKALGEMIGVTGTPAILLEDGTLIPGYQPPKQLAAALARSTQDEASSE